MRNRRNNYSSYYNEPAVKEEEVKEETPVVEEAAPEEIKEVVEEEKSATTYVSPAVVGVPKKGKVVNCERVNVRVRPDTDPTTPIATIILFGEEVDVDPSKSTDKYYAVTTNMNIDGFILKDFVEVV